MRIIALNGIPLSLLCLGSKRHTFTGVCWSLQRDFDSHVLAFSYFKYENIQKNIQDLNTLQEDSEEKQDKWDSFNVLNGTALIPYKYNVSENPGHQEEATGVSRFLVWQRKKPWVIYVPS